MSVANAGMTLPFELAPRTTPADATKDTSTLDRALDEVTRTLVFDPQTPVAHCI